MRAENLIRQGPQQPPARIVHHLDNVWRPLDCEPEPPETLCIQSGNSLLFLRQVQRSPLFLVPLSAAFGVLVLAVIVLAAHKLADATSLKKVLGILFVEAQADGGKRC